jgi:hypothetical protein
MRYLEGFMAGPSVRAGLAFSLGMTEMEKRKGRIEFLDSALQENYPADAV